MQNFNNFLQFPSIQSFYYIPSQLQYYAYLPVTPSTPQTLTPVTQYSYNSQNTFRFPSHIERFYDKNDQVLYNHESSSSLLQNRVVDPLSQQWKNTSQQKYQNKTPLTLLTEHQIYNQSTKDLIKSEQQTVMKKLENPKQKLNELKAEKRKNFKNQDDRQYLPQIDRKRKHLIKYQQNQNRNVVPNEINQIFSFIQKQNKSGPLLEKVFSQNPHPQSFTVKRFYLYQSLLRNKLGHYTNQKSLKLVTQLYEPKCESWSEEEQRFYNKVSRVLIRHFLYQDSIFIILTSKRMKKDKKTDHLRARRQIAQSVIKVLRGF